MPKKQQKDPERVAAAYKGLMNKQVTSPKRKLVEADYRRWIRNAVVFLIPAVVVFLTALANGQDVQQAANVLYLWFLNTLIDLVQKWAKENKYSE